jgi:hypothetical protein
LYSILDPTGTLKSDPSVQPLLSNYTDYSSPAPV